MNQLDIDKVIDVYKDTVALTAERLHKVHEALWKARSEAVRAVVTVATAVLAGLVVFLEDLLAGHTLAQRILLLASWALLLVSIGFGIAVGWLSITLRSFHPALFNSQLEVRDRCSQLDPSAPDIREQIAAVAKSIVERVTAPIGTADRRANRAAYSCLVAFLMSLVSLVAFAAVRILCGDT